MNYLTRKKVAYMPIVSKIKGFERKVSGKPPIMVYDSVGEGSLIDYSIYGSGAGENGVGEKTVNLFDSSQITEAKGWSVNEEGEYTGGIASIWNTFNFGLSGKDGKFSITIPEGTTRVSVSFEGRNHTTNSRVFSIGFYYTDGSHSAVPGQYTASTEWKEYRVQSTKGKVISRIVAEYAYTDTVSIRNIQITPTESYLPYEPYGKYKIPISASDGVAELQESPVNIYIDSPLASGEHISMTADGLPELPMIAGDIVYTVNTEVQPSEVDITYFSTEK